MAVAIRAIVQTVGDPGALGVLVLLVVGLFVCFLGARYFRLSAGVIGFVVGMELAGRLAIWQDWGPVTRVVSGLVGGATLAALFVVFVFVGVFGLGSLLAMTLVRGATGVAGRSVGPLELVLAALIGGFAALLVRRHVGIVATALYGGIAGIAAVFTLVRRGGLGGAVGRMANPGSGAELVVYLLCVSVLVTGGLVVQFRSGRNSRLERGK
ncbi:DUF4203 domain-containing protein [bacterium]|nr:DUF4203 domain-containing protein [bacterium]